MKPKKASAAPSNPVDAFMAKLQHPLKADIAAVRGLILAVSPTITEEIKWNAPGFRTTESFATVHLRATDQLQLIFHLGAKVRPGFAGDEDRRPGRPAEVAGQGPRAGDSRADKAAFRKIVRAWIKYV